MICKICGKEDHLRWINPTRDKLIKFKRCFDCNYWLEKIEDKSPNKLVIDGCVYYIGDKNNSCPAQFRGHNGKKFVIKKFDGDVIETVDLWFCSKIPERFRSELQDNAEFMEV